MQQMMASKGINSLSAAGNSTFMRLRNSDGTANVTQVSIVVDSINATVMDLMNKVVGVSKDVAALSQAVGPGADAELAKEFNAALVRFIKSITSASELMEGFGTIFEGGVGVVEQEWGGCAPLMRHPDGSARGEALFAEVRGIPRHVPQPAGDDAHHQEEPPQHAVHPNAVVDEQQLHGQDLAQAAGTPLPVRRLQAFTAPSPLSSGSSSECDAVQHDRPTVVGITPERPRQHEQRTRPSAADSVMIALESLQTSAAETRISTIESELEETRAMMRAMTTPMSEMTA